MEEKLTQYLLEKYTPAALVLHGSRANGNYKEHSDWDLVIFTNKPSGVVGREIVFGANIEVKEIVLPIKEDKFLGFYFRTENVKVLHDPMGIIPGILERQDSYVAKGNTFEGVDILKRKAFLLSAIDGMADYADNPLILFDKKIDFYTRTVDSWFRFKKNEFEPSHYIAFDRMKSEDPEFFDLISELVKSSNPADLIRIGNDVISHLFD